MIQFVGSVPQQVEQGIEREWLETNGIGGFASSTILGMNTRRYHGLLVASLRHQFDRYVLLSKLEETLVIDVLALTFPSTSTPERCIHRGTNT